MMNSGRPSVGTGTMMAAGFAFLVQLMIIVFAYLSFPDHVATSQWVAAFYYPAALIVSTIPTVQQLPLAVVVVILVPAFGVSCYSMTIGLLWTASRKFREEQQVRRKRG
jgi:hypothetical protein